MKTGINDARACAAGVILPGYLAITRRTTETEIRDLLQKLKPVRGGALLRRLGPEADGGYLVPDDLQGVTACFSPGVCNESGFEKACADEGIRVFMTDASVDGPAIDHSLFSFSKKFLGANTVGDVITLGDWMVMCLTGQDDDALLQMDIEGHEYATLLATPTELLSRFRIMVIEFHDLGELWNRPFFGLVRATMEKLLASHVCVHIHPNNYAAPVVRRGISLVPMMEFTFLRRDRANDLTPVTTFPHPLDRDNTSRPGFALPKSWYGA